MICMFFLVQAESGLPLIRMKGRPLSPWTKKNIQIIVGFNVFYNNCIFLLIYLLNLHLD